MPGGSREGRRSILCPAHKEAFAEVAVGTGAGQYPAWISVPPRPNCGARAGRSHFLRPDRNASSATRTRAGPPPPHVLPARGTGAAPRGSSEGWAPRARPTHCRRPQSGGRAPGSVVSGREAFPFTKLFFPFPSYFVPNFPGRDSSSVSMFSFLLSDEC